MLQRSDSQMVQAIPAADMASVSVLRGDKAETAASNSERVWAIDLDQYAAGEGLFLEAARTGRIVRVSLQDALERWPAFAGSTRAARVASYLSAPLAIDSKFGGSLNLYSHQVHGFDDLDEKLLQVYTTAAVAAIANALRYTEINLLNAVAVRDSLLRALDRGASTVIADMTRTRFCDAATHTGRPCPGRGGRSRRVRRNGWW